MARTRLMVLTALTMMAFAGNSLLCRLALTCTNIDPASFTSIRLVSGAVVLWLIVSLKRDSPTGAGNWLSASALFVYAAGFSFAYVNLSAATGALLLFGAVQATMIGQGIRTGESLQRWQIAGFVLALGGLVGLLLPGLAAPPLSSCLMMLSAGVAWGVYSLRGKGARHPTQVTAGNFLRAVPVTAALSVFMQHRFSPDPAGIWYAVASGALASGIGYVLWYSVVPALNATTAAIVQLTVPVIASIGGIVFLGETVTLRLALASLAILGGVALVVLGKPKRRDPEPR